MKVEKKVMVEPRRIAEKHERADETPVIDKKHDIPEYREKDGCDGALKGDKTQKASHASLTPGIRRQPDRQRAGDGGDGQRCGHRNADNGWGHDGSDADT